jgi:hypothetical protein
MLKALARSEEAERQNKYLTCSKKVTRYPLTPVHKKLTIKRY